MPLMSSPPDLTTIAASYAAAMGHHTVLFSGAPGGVPGLEPHCPLLPHTRHQWTTSVTTRNDHGKLPSCSVLMFVCLRLHEQCPSAFIKGFRLNLIVIDTKFRFPTLQVGEVANLYLSLTFSTIESNKHACSSLPMTLGFHLKHFSTVHAYVFKETRALQCLLVYDVVSWQQSKIFKQQINICTTQLRQQSKRKPPSILVTIERHYTFNNVYKKHF